MTRDEAIALVQRIMDTDYSDNGEASHWLESLDAAFHCPSGYVSDLIFWPVTGDPTAADVVDQAQAYRPIAL
ncbi:hypothetical protein GCM10009839_94000 [Catenulispora yoronensis]|uniref:E9imm peptide n=1 Tax=Catenulispora yoronensis TaxID=450799 RepID=A0ABP5HE99_9ACTN